MILQEFWMPFTESQRCRFISILEGDGWRMHEGVLWSPSSGLYFNDSHFHQWGPKEMRDIFKARANRIERAALENWKAATDENRQVSAAAATVFNATGT